MTAYLPLSIMPLYLAAFCIFLACKRGSLPYGILCAVASTAIMFAMTGLTVKWFFMLFMFAPYGILTYFIHRFSYFKVKWAIVRAVIAVLYFNMTFGFVYLVAVNVATIGLDIPVLDWADKFGGYAVLAVIATVILVPLDFIFSSLSLVILKKIPSTDVEKRIVPDSPVTTDEGGRKFDIFGYEITDEKPNGETARDTGEADDPPEDGGGDDAEPHDGDGE